MPRWRSDMQAAIAAAEVVAAGGDTRGFTACLPAIIHEQDTAAAHTLVMRFGAVPDLLPEHLMLLGVSGLTGAQQRAMLAALMPAAAEWPDDAITQTAQLSGRMGAYGFSFPLWRFLTQRTAAPALLEQYGFTRTERPTDVRNASLPRHDPARDLYGMGFVHQDDAWTVEYRRAYILCACHAPDDAAAVVIRNSSYFFGRDRLPAPVYAAFGAVPRDLDVADGSSAGLQPWLTALAGADALPAYEKIRRVINVLARIDMQEQAISNWLCGDGAAAAAEYMQQVAPFYIGRVDAAYPPWFPQNVAVATPAHLDAVRASLLPQQKIAFLSGAAGDFAAPPAGYTP